MKTKLFSWKPLLVAAGLMITASTGFSGGWFLPTRMPAGEYHKYWDIGLSAPMLEQNAKVTTLKDGTHIFAFNAGNGAGHIYLWDRISPDYNSPVVASTDPKFGEYTTLDLNNMNFLKNVYGQLKERWGDGGTPAQHALVTKLWTAIERYSGGRPF